MKALQVSSGTQHTDTIVYYKHFHVFAIKYWNIWKN